MDDKTHIHTAYPPPIHTNKKQQPVFTFGQQSSNENETENETYNNDMAHNYNLETLSYPSDNIYNFTDNKYENDIQYQEELPSPKSYNLSECNLNAFYQEIPLFPLSLMQNILMCLCQKSHLLFNIPEFQSSTYFNELLLKSLQKTFYCPISQWVCDVNMSPYDLSKTIASLNNIKNEKENDKLFIILILYDIQLLPHITQRTLLEILKFKKIRLPKPDSEFNNELYPLDIFQEQTPPTQETIISQIFIIATHKEKFELPRSLCDIFLLEVFADQTLCTLLQKYLTSNPSFIISNQDLLSLIKHLNELSSTVYFDRSLKQFCYDIVVSIRQHGQVAIGPSPLAHQQFLSTVKLFSVMNGSTYVRPVDIDVNSIESLSHRILLRSYHPKLSRNITAHLVFNVMTPPK